MIGVGLYIEESLQEITARFRAEVARKIGLRESSLRLAAPILLKDVARAVGRAQPANEPWRRAIMLIPSQSEKGIRGLVLEFGELRAAVWDTLAAREHAAPRAERAFIDRMLDEALAEAAERWATMARLLPLNQAASSLEPERAPRPGPLPSGPKGASEPGSASGPPRASGWPKTSVPPRAPMPPRPSGSPRARPPVPPRPSVPTHGSVPPRARPRPQPPPLPRVPGSTHGSDGRH